MLSEIVQSSIRPPQAGQKSVWKLSDQVCIVDALQWCQDYNRFEYNCQKLQEMEQQQMEVEEEQIVLPDYGEVEGEKVKLSGLDYSLIKQQTATQRKHQLLNKIKSKLNQMSYSLPVVATQENSKNSNNDELSRSILLTKSTKPKIDSSTFYLFPLDAQFSPELPQLITRRFGKMHFTPLYLHHQTDEIKELRNLIERDERIKQSKEQRQKESANDFAYLNDDNNEQQDSDDIFGCDQKDKKAPALIKVGKKLNFGIDQHQIFGGKGYKERQEGEEVVVQVQPKDKYEFLRKKVKKDAEEDYGECYPQTGPSLQEMRELRKEGIELFGEQKVRVEKERKYDVNKDYQKVKRIMDENAKKQK